VARRALSNRFDSALPTTHCWDDVRSRGALREWCTRVHRHLL
jgi:hypothetical protein